MNFLFFASVRYRKQISLSLSLAVVSNEKKKKQQLLIAMEKSQKLDTEKKKKKREFWNLKMLLRSPFSKWGGEGEIPTVAQ